MIKKKGQSSENKNNSESVYKIYILGDSNTGKTQLLHRFIDNNFTDNVEKTIDIDSKLKNIKSGNENFTVLFYDINGNETCRSNYHQSYNSALGAILVFDLTNRNTFEQMKKYYNDFSSMSSPNSYIILIGNKVDLCNSGNRQITEQEAINFAKSHNIPYLEVSAKKDINVQETFLNFVEEIHRKAKNKSSSISPSKNIDKKKGKELEKENLNNEISEIKNEIRSNEKEIARLSIENNSFRESIEILQKSLEETQQRDEMYQNQIKELERKIKEKQSHFQCSQLNQIEPEELDKFKKIEKISSDPTFDMYKVSSDEHMALKVFDIDLSNEEEESDVNSLTFNLMKKLMSEYESINKLNHPNIIKTYGICTSDLNHPPSILLEFCPSNLSAKINGLSNVECVSVIFEVASAMMHVHQAGLIHRNLKPENVLLDSNNHAKVSDFGMSTLIDISSFTQSRTRDIVSSMKFVAPELLDDDQNYNEKVDVFAFGAIIFFVVTRGSLPKVTALDVARGKTAEIPKSINEKARKLIRDCWSVQPEERPSFAEIVERIKECNFGLIDGVEKDIESICAHLSI